MPALAPAWPDKGTQAVGGCRWDGEGLGRRWWLLYALSQSLFKRLPQGPSGGDGGGLMTTTKPPNAASVLEAMRLLQLAIRFDRLKPLHLEEQKAIRHVVSFLCFLLGDDEDCPPCRNGVHGNCADCEGSTPCPCIGLQRDPRPGGSTALGLNVRPLAVKLWADSTVDDVTRAAEQIVEVLQPQPLPDNVRKLAASLGYDVDVMQLYAERLAAHCRSCPDCQRVRFPICATAQQLLQESNRATSGATT